MFNDPPAILSTKDLLYLEDMLSWNLNLIKKSNFYAGFCQDSNVKKTLNEMCRMHEEHYQELLDHLNHHLNQTAQAGQTVKGASSNAGTEQQLS